MDRTTTSPEFNANSDLYRNALGLLNPFGIVFHRLLHPERRVTGAHRMILVRERRAEQRHDAVAHDLIDCTLVAVHRFHHVLEHRIEDFPRLLRIAVGEQLHRALHVGEQHRHLLALAFERTLRGENLLSEVFGSINSRRSEARCYAGRALTDCPHSRQNFAPAGSSVPHAAHLRARGVPHSRQNFACGGFSCWQRGHLIMQTFSSKFLDLQTSDSTNVSDSSPRRRAESEC